MSHNFVSNRTPWLPSFLSASSIKRLRLKGCQGRSTSRSEACPSSSTLSKKAEILREYIPSWKEAKKASLPEPSQALEKKKATVEGGGRTHGHVAKRYQTVSQTWKRGSQWQKGKVRTRGTVPIRSLRTQRGKLTGWGRLLIQKGGKERKQAKRQTRSH